MRFAEKLKTVREQLNLTQTQLAAELGVSYVSVNRWENEQTTPTPLAVKTFDAFCKTKSIQLC